MELDPELWYDMELDDFMLMQKGFFNKRKADDIRFGKVAFYIAAIHQNFAGKSIYMSRFLSDWLGEKPKGLTKDEQKDRSSKLMERVRQKNKILEEKEKVVKQANKFNGKKRKVKNAKRA